jgi:hypothetical protein
LCPHTDTKLMYVYSRTWPPHDHARRHDAEKDLKAEQDARKRAKEPSAGVRLIFKVVRAEAIERVRGVTFSSETMKAFGQSVQERVMRSVAECLQPQALVNGDVVRRREQQAELLHNLTSTFRAPAGSSRAGVLSELVASARQFVEGDAEPHEPTVVLLQVCNVCVDNDQSSVCDVYCIRVLVCFCACEIKYNASVYVCGHLSVCTQVCLSMFMHYMYVRVYLRHL